MKNFFRKNLLAAAIAGLGMAQAHAAVTVNVGTNNWYNKASMGSVFLPAGELNGAEAPQILDLIDQATYTIMIDPSSTFFDYEVFYMKSRVPGVFGYYWTPMQALSTAGNIIKVADLSQANPSFTFNELRDSNGQAIIDAGDWTKKGVLYFVPKAGTDTYFSGKKSIINASAVIEEQYQADAQALYGANAVLSSIKGGLGVFEFKTNADYFPARKFSQADFNYATESNAVGWLNLAFTSKEGQVFKPNSTSAVRVMTLMDDVGLNNLKNNYQTGYYSPTASECVINIRDAATNADITGQFTSAAPKTSLRYANPSSHPEERNIVLDLYCPVLENGVFTFSKTDTATVTYKKAGEISDIKPYVVPGISKDTTKIGVDSAPTLTVVDSAKALCSSVSVLGDTAALAAGECAALPSADTTAQAGVGFTKNAVTGAVQFTPTSTGNFIISWDIYKKKTDGSVANIGTTNAVSSYWSEATPISLTSPTEGLKVKKGADSSIGSLQVNGEPGARVYYSIKNAAGSSVLPNNAESSSVLIGLNGVGIIPVLTKTDAERLVVDNRNVGDSIPLNFNVWYDGFDGKATSTTPHNYNALTSADVKVIPASDILLNRTTSSIQVLNTQETNKISYQLAMADSTPYSVSAYGEGWTTTVAQIRQSGRTSWNDLTGVATSTNVSTSGAVDLKIDARSMIVGQSYDLRLSVTNPNLGLTVMNDVSFSVIKPMGVSGTLSTSDPAFFLGDKKPKVILTPEELEMKARLSKATWKWRKKGFLDWVEAKTTEVADFGFAFEKEFNIGTYEVMVSTESNTSEKWDSQIAEINVYKSALTGVGVAPAAVLPGERIKLPIAVAADGRTLSDFVLFASSDNGKTFGALSSDALPTGVTPWSSVDGFTASLDTQNSALILNPKQDFDHIGAGNRSLPLQFKVVDKRAASSFTTLLETAKAVKSQASVINIDGAALGVGGLPKIVEFGNTYKLMLVGQAPFGRKYTGDIAKLTGKMVTSDGQQIPYEIDVSGPAKAGSTTIEWTPVETTTNSAGEIVTKTIEPSVKFDSYYEFADGKKFNAQPYVKEFKIATYAYQWPTFGLEVKQSSAEAPSQNVINVTTTKPIPFSALNGVRYEFSVAAPLGMVEGTDYAMKQRDSMLVLNAMKAGTYAVTVNISDNRGNTATATKEIVLVEPGEITIEFEKAYSNAAMRYPLVTQLKLSANGGHKAERITSIVWESNAKETAGRGIRGVILADASGTAEVRATINTSLGRTFSKTDTITVNPNVAPTCPTGISKVSVSTKTDEYRLNNCKDVDGRIRYVTWMLNGEKLSAGGLSIRLLKTTEVNSLTAEIFDDSNESTKYQFGSSTAVSSTGGSSIGSYAPLGSTTTP